MVTVKEKNGVTYAVYRDSEIAYTKDGIVYASPIKEPIPGLIIMKNVIRPYDGKPEVRKIVHGIEHVLVGFEKDETPVYAVKVGEEYYTTIDFNKYYSWTWREYSAAEIIDMIRKIDEKEKYQSARVDGKKIRGLTASEEKVTKFLYADDRKVFVAAVPFEVLEKKKDFTVEELEEYAEQIIFSFPKGFGESVESIEHKENEVKYYLKNGKVLTFGMKGTIKYELSNVEPEDLEKILAGEVDFEEFEKLAKKIDSDFPPVEGEDVLTALKKLASKYPYFGKDYAVPRKNFVITKRGFLRVKNLSNVPKSILDLTEWVLGVHSNYNIDERTVVKVFLDGENSYARVYRVSSPAVLRIGGHYYWYHVDRGRYIGTGGFEYVDRYEAVVSYNSKKLIIGKATVVPKSTIEKLERGEKITISDVLPGFPKDGKIEDHYFTVGVKKSKLYINEYRLGIMVTIPFKDGLYEVYIPYDEPVDAWSLLMAEDLPEENIIKEYVRIGFGHEIPDDAKIMYDGFSYRVEWGNNYVEVKGTTSKVPRLFAEIGGKRAVVKGRESVNLLLNAESIEEFIFMVGMI